MSNDELWKGIIEDLDIEFLQKFYPNDMHLFDLTKPIVFLDKELAQLLPDSEDSSRVVDKLLQVTLKDGNHRLILIHPEVQGYRHSNYDEREFIYFYRIYDRFKLPIATLVIFTDTDPNYEPNCFSYNFLGTELTYKYPTYKILNQSSEALEVSDNLFDIVILTTYWAIKSKRGEITEEALLIIKINLMRNLLERKVDKSRIRKLLLFIRAYIRFEKPEINLKFEQNYEEILKIDEPMGVEEILRKQAKEEGIALGMEKGMEKGIEKGMQKARTEAEIEKHNLLKNVIANMRSEGFDIDKIANLMAIPTAQIAAFLKELDTDSNNE